MFGLGVLGAGTAIAGLSSAIGAHRQRKALKDAVARRQRQQGGLGQAKRHSLKTTSSLDAAARLRGLQAELSRDGGLSAQDRELLANAAAGAGADAQRGIDIASEQLAQSQAEGLERAKLELAGAPTAGEVAASQVGNVLMTGAKGAIPDAIENYGKQQTLDAEATQLAVQEANAAALGSAYDYEKQMYGPKALT